MANARNHIERRMAFLEKTYLEDRERWRKNDKRWSVAVRILERQGNELKRQGDEIKRQGDQLDVTLRMLRRHLEQ